VTLPVLTDEAIEDEVRLALADAALSASRVLIHVHERMWEAPSKAAGHLRPGQPASGEDELDLDDDDELAKLNSANDVARHRIVLYASYGEESRLVFAGLLRHELEHVRQWEVLGDAPFQLSQLIDDIHYARFADAPEERYLYRAKPDEQDANAAAAAYLVGRAPDAPERLHIEPWYPLIWSFTRPEPIGTLVARSVCFLFQYPELCAHWEQENRTTFVGALEDIDASAAALWRMLTQFVSGRATTG
jgi:hypothetical protein